MAKKTKNAVAETPLMKQYNTIKSKYPDAILFFRMGDFYEMFFEDAKKASKILEITLTSRNKKNESPVPMCGVPFRAAHGCNCTVKHINKCALFVSCLKVIKKFKIPAG